MPSTQEFRRRIKSVNNTKQITKAMEMIASIKMQKAIRNINQARTYIQEAWNVLSRLAGLVLPQDHPLIAGHTKSNRTAVILVTSDRGLCGSYNSEVIKKMTSFVRSDVISSDSERSRANEISHSVRNDNLDIIAIGKVGANYVKRYRLGNLVAEFKGFENDFSIEDIVPISKLSSGEFLAGNYNKVVLIYSHFKSTLKQIPVVKQILPIAEDHIDHPELWESEKLSDVRSPLSEKNDGKLTTENGKLEYKFEPNPDAVFDSVLRQILRTQVYGAVLEANASEHSARMMAMSGATENAKELIDDLTLSYNSVRQDSITRQISEIAGAAEAMK